ncbi:MAG: bifunctional UDP-N-acetylglucosamine diphosphorylase/glucosamine-1-phosphate N-acetyltransferase GlmU [Candidatus Eremiobacter antarcticus]|nr:bifunctional UDP-N-acetylglucosamine diphosphorylase/glucosamine-1-phosphate N-acetyltransferase GlmU [Candidatus Eremiobacteraeota bacterium]MBC5808388.1 bifunctional UDP-N-acetylglucosamine diphosphorylase/glucosamine-1-phosphate N-acetyltransferase GlmU [Candidatus Eremiobacteraeota bacterium]
MSSRSEPPGASVDAIVLAAGKGTRMKSRRPKVLHELCGRSMLGHILHTLRASGIDGISVVVSPEMYAQVSKDDGFEAVIQDPQLGTGHAVQMALAHLDAIAPSALDRGVLVLGADMPLIPASLIERVISTTRSRPGTTALVTARVALPSFFGRIIRERGALVRIVEQRDATPPQLQIDEVNAGIYCFDGPGLRHAIGKLRADNAQRELYLTDCIAAIVAAGGRVETVEAEAAADVAGINNQVELAAARALLQERVLREHMLAGVTIVDPRSTYVDSGVAIGQDTTIHPQTHLLGDTVIGQGCEIGPNTVIANSRVADSAQIQQSTIKDSAVGEGVTIGPFAHLRSNTTVESGAHIGNFVEMKKSRMGRGAKAGHLTYLGDADVGENANIGAGTITCNYDGTHKHKTKVGKSAFIGSNSSLVAPLDVGEGALTGAGSVVIRDVPPGERVVGNPARALPKKNAKP